MNRLNVSNIISNSPAELMKELNYFLDQYSDDSDYSLIDSFNDVIDLAQDTNDKHTFNLCKPVLINIGYCIPVNPDNITSTGKKYWFKYNGLYYDVKCSWNEFINSL